MSLNAPGKQPAPSVDAFVAALARDGERALGTAVEELRVAETAPLPDAVPAVLRTALAAAGRERVFLHQHAAITHALAGRNVVVATETSSGKSLCFQVPVLSATLTDPAAHALFLFPTNPLANDQEASLRSLLSHLPGTALRGPVRLQGAMGAQKDRLAADDPQIVMTNPEMVQLHLLPQHRRWERFWAGLRYIVVDEIHLYRGAFGGHVANLLRRVRRCAWRYGAQPVVIAASATVHDPRGLAEELCAAKFELVDRSTAPRGKRTTVLWKPPPKKDGEPKNHLDEAVELFQRGLDAGLQTILFARSRQLVETLVSKLEERTGRTRVALGVRAYRAGYLREEREIIEKGLKNGSIRGVVTTNALEVGIDIGTLDVCVMAGYPGSVTALRQQAGRVGRRDRSSAVVLVASPNPLDMWLLDHPQVLASATAERAVVGRRNPFVLRSHLACAASEFPLWEAEIERLGGDGARLLAQDLVQRGEARWEQEGTRRVLVAQGRPHGQVSLRSTSQERWKLIDPEGGEIGEIDGASVRREAHPGAVYLHQGRAFRVERLHEGRVQLSLAPRYASTRVQAERAVTAGAATATKTLEGGWLTASLAPVSVVDRYSSFLETGQYGKGAVTKQITPPLEARIDTEGLVLRLSAAAAQTLKAGGSEALEAALHASEHVLVALASAVALCDRDDLEGHTEVTSDGATLVLFDRQPGGMGFAAAAFEELERLVSEADEAVRRCTCRDGCPACIHSGRCLRGNDAVSKHGAAVLLGLANGRTPAAGAMNGVRVRKAGTRAATTRAEVPVKAAIPEAAPEAGPRFQVGDRVEHASYGQGVVKEVRPLGRIVVVFEGDGGETAIRKIRSGWLKKA